MTFKEFIKSADDEELAVLLMLVMMTAIKSQGISTNNLNPSYEKAEFKKMLNDPISESLLDTIYMYKNYDKPLS